MTWTHRPRRMGVPSAFWLVAAASDWRFVRESPNPREKLCVCRPEVAVSSAFGARKSQPHYPQSPHNNSSQPATFLRWQEGPTPRGSGRYVRRRWFRKRRQSICHVRRRSRAQSAERAVVRTAVPSLTIPLAQATGPDGRPSHRTWHALKSRPVKTQTKWHGSLVEKMADLRPKRNSKRVVCTPGLAGNRLCT